MNPQEIFSLHPKLADAFYSHMSMVKSASPKERLSRCAFLLSLAQEARQKGALDNLRRCSQALNDYSHSDYPHFLEALYRSSQVAGIDVIKVFPARKLTDYNLVKKALTQALSLFSKVPVGNPSDDIYNRLLALYEFFRFDSQNPRSQKNFFRRLPLEDANA